MLTITLKVKWVLVGLSLAALVGAGTLGVFVSRIAVPRVYLAGERFLQGEHDQLKARLESILGAPITLYWQEGTWHFRPEELGITVALEQALEEAAQAGVLPLWRRVPLWLAGRLEEVHIPLSVQVD